MRRRIITLVLALASALVTALPVLASVSNVD